MAPSPSSIQTTGVKQTAASSAETAEEKVMSPKEKLIAETERKIQEIADKQGLDYGIPEKAIA